MGRKELGGIEEKALKQFKEGKLLISVFFI